METFSLLSDSPGARAIQIVAGIVAREICIFERDCDQKKCGRDGFLEPQRAKQREERVFAPQ
jgi:hypothetical protein